MRICARVHLFVCVCESLEFALSDERWPALKTETEEKRDGGGTLADFDPEVPAFAP